MKVASHAVIKWRETKPLPGELTNERINNATLPIKIETARRAIAQCTDLPELLRYKDQAEGLAAAVRTMKHVGPEMIKNVNCLMVDAWRKGGELLAEYSSEKKFLGAGRGWEKSPRIKLANGLGLTVHEAGSLVRVAKAPPKKVYEAAQKSRYLEAVARTLPPINPMSGPGARAYSTGLAGVINKLTTAYSAVRRVDSPGLRLLAADERKIVKAKITEIIELLDEMDRLCR